MRRTSMFTVAAMSAVLTVGTFAGAGSATALTPGPSVTAGTLLPVHPLDADHGTFFPYASSSYLGFGRIQRDDFATGTPIELRRVSDGSLARTVTVDSANRDVLSGSALVHWRPPLVPEPTPVVATDIESGQTSWTIEVPATETIVSTGETWVLSSIKEGWHDAVLRRPGKPDLSVSGMALGDGFNASARGDSRGLVVTSGSAAWALDLETGVANLLFVGQHVPRVYAGPTRFFVVDELSPTSDDVIRWWDRVGSGHGEVTVAQVVGASGYVSFGNRLASLRRLDSWHYDVEPVDLTTGARAAAVVSNALEVRPLGDGRVAALLGDTPNGRIVMVEDGGSPSTFADLPEVGENVTGLGIGAGQAVVQYGNPDYPTTTSTWTAPLDGSAKPVPLTDGTQHVAGGLVQAAGSTVLTTASSPAQVTRAYAVTWPGGHRELTVTAQAVSLGSGGQVLLRSSGDTALEDARTGASLGSVPETQSFAVDGRTLWTLSADAGFLTSHDLSGAAADRTVRTGLAATCGGAGLQVVGRFALVHCGDSHFVVDTRGVYLPWKARGATATWSSTPVLGAGFVTWIGFQKDQNGEWYPAVSAQDLGPGRQLKLYGPAGGPVMPPYPAVAADDSAPRLAYLDSTHLARRVDLNWLTTPATAIVDTTAPVVATLGGSARASAGPLKAGWTFTDNSPTQYFGSGLLDYDVRYQQQPVGAPVVETAWLAPTAMSHLKVTSADLPSTVGKDTCWSVRGRDRAGNVSGWSAVKCTTVDATGPVITVTAPSALATTSTAALVAYAGSDTSGVASYDVRYRRATYDGSFGAYATPFAATTATKVAVNLAAGYQYCFSIRGRDKLGNVSAWTAERCISKVLDDRTLTRSSTSWVKGTGSAYYGSTVTSTTKSGVSLTRAGVRARQVYVLTTTCPTCGSVAVYVGNTKMGTMSLYSSTTRNRVLKSTPLTLANIGTLKLVSTTSGKTVRVDAFAVRSW